VRNTDPSNTATGVVLTDTLGANLNYVSASASQGNVSVSGSVVTGTLGNLAAGASATLTVTAQAAEDGSLTDSASVTSTSSDPNSSNNSGSATTPVAEPLIVVSGPISTTQRTVSNLNVATFTHAGGIEPAGAFNATIDWGDGHTSSGTISLSGSTYTVVGSHRYRSGNSHTITTTVNEPGAAAQLLLAKAGDEVPDLPAHFKNGSDSDPDHGRSLVNRQTNDFASLVDAFVAPHPNGSVPTIAELRGSLIALFDFGDQHGSAPDLSILVGSLQHRNRGDSRDVEALLLIADVLAERG
jgi:hypothetical protein